MANIGMHVDNAGLDPVLNFFILQLLAPPYSPFLPDGVTPNPQTKLQYVEQKLTEYYAAIWNRYLKNTLLQAYEATLPLDTSIG